MPIVAPIDEEPTAAGSLRRTASYWASLPSKTVVAELAGLVDGLSEAEAALRLERYGANRLPESARARWYVEIAANFLHFFAILLWIGAALGWLAGSPQIALAIVAVILINGGFSYWQQYQAERAVEALTALLPREVTVRRSGQPLLVPAADIVPGDVLLLSEGEAVPADARLIAATALRLDISSLTGESRPVARYAREVDPTGRGPSELPNLVLAGTSVTAGCGEAVVFATAGVTEFGRIAELTQRQEVRPSPLALELSRITRVITALAISTGGLFFVLSTAGAGLSLLNGLLFGVGVIAAFVPEGLLPTVTLSLAVGVRRMAARNALVKRLDKVETLGATTVILTDKTGTLTKNEMTVREVWVGGAGYRFSGVGYDREGTAEVAPGSPSDAQGFFDLIRTAALCCDASVAQSRATGDPMEAAIMVAAAKAGIGPDLLNDWPRLAELPFDSLRKRMTTIQQIEKRPTACVKGAASELLPLCATIRWKGRIVPLSDALRAAVTAVHDGLAGRALRVLAVAQRGLDVAPNETNNHWRAKDVERDLTLLGLVAMEDPPRPEVPAAVGACHQAGVRVVMVTGDHGLTATAIGREIGLYHDDVRVVTGQELNHFDRAEIDELLAEPQILFARVSPEHKLTLVEAFQRRGEVVAVTGDGVNDGPALKRADVGIAMGRDGTDVAREAAAVVLSDDSFASIVAAIEVGRAVFDNIRKFITYIFASNVAEAVPFTLFVLCGIPLPLAVMQILAVDLGTDMLPALALGTERPEPDVMRRPPRRRNERLLDAPLLLRGYVWLGLLQAAFSLSAYFFAYWWAGWRPGQPLLASDPAYTTAVTMTLGGIVACQAANALACRSSRWSIVSIGFWSNPRLLGGVVFSFLLLTLLIYVPSLANVFGLAPLGTLHWLYLSMLAPFYLACEEVRKAVARRLARTKGQLHRTSMNTSTS